MQFEKLLVLNSNIPRHAYNDIFEMNFTVNLQKLIKFFQIHGPRTKIDRHLSLRCSSLSDREQITVVDGMVKDEEWGRICQPRFPSPMSRRSIQEKSVWGLQNCLCLRLHPVWVTMEPFDPTLHPADILDYVEAPRRNCRPENLLNNFSWVSGSWCPSSMMISIELAAMAKSASEPPKDTSE